MIEIKDLNKYERDLSTYYGGRSGSKYAIMINGERWMIKFPENTKDFKGREKNNVHLPSYTASPLSEYIGSQIYQSLGIPVHETMLGIRDNRHGGRAGAQFIRRARRGINRCAECY